MRAVLPSHGPAGFQSVVAAHAPATIARSALLYNPAGRG
jgi:hypothetical protein